MKDREPGQFNMGDGPIEKESRLGEEAALQFVRGGIESYSSAIARYSLVPTPTPDWRKAQGEDEEIAEFLSEVGIDDPILRKNVGKISPNPSPELVAQAASVAIAKARVEAEEAPPQAKSALEKLTDRVLKETGNFIAGRGGKKALTATLIPVLAAACSSPANAVTQPRPIDTQESVAPEVFTPTAEIVPRPTEEGASTSEPEPTNFVELGPDAEETRSRLEEQGLEVEIRELSDGTETLVIEREWTLDVSDAFLQPVFRAAENAELVVSKDDDKEASLVYHQEQTLAFIDETQGSFMVQGGQIMAWQEGAWRQVELPQEAGEIAFFDIHEGAWYGINSSNRAVVKLNNEGEWEEYVRPLNIALQSRSFPEGLPQDALALLEELDEEQELRLVDSQGSEFPYGYLYEWSHYEDGHATHVFVSGYTLGTVDYVMNDWRTYWTLFEVPLRYERQILVFSLPNQTDTYLNLYLIPASRNVDERFQRPRPWADLIRATEMPQAIGNQMVLAFQTNESSSEIYACIYNDAWDELVANLRRGEALVVDTLFTPSFTWADETLFEE